MATAFRRASARTVAFVFLTLLSAHLAPTAAMSVTPIHLEMASSGGRSQVTVTNDSDTPLPIETVVQKLSLDETGKRTLTKSEEDFLIFPAQTLIAPGASQVFRIQWVGEPMLAQSASFVVSFNQIPVKLPKDKSGVQVVMSFGVVVNVAPPGGTPDLKVIGAGVETGKDGKRHPTITVENPTKTHALLSQAGIAFSAAAWSQSLTASEVAEKIGVGLVQPGKRRKFTIPIDLPANTSNVAATLDFKPKR